MPNLDLKPKYRVELVVEGKGNRTKHFYDVFTGSNPDVRTHRFAGVTGVLGVISKPALVPWATKTALESVKTVLLREVMDPKPRLIGAEWIEEIILAAKKVPEEMKTAAGDLGTTAHAYIDKIIHGESIAEMPEAVQPAVNAFMDWWNQSGIELVMGDTKVASLKYGFGGSLDALGRRNGKFVILDWKTSNGLYDEYALQVAAYAQAFQETFGISVADAVVVRFSKKQPVEFEHKEVKNLDASFAAFMHAKNLKASLDLAHFA